MNAFWASENCDAFIVFRSSQPGENTAENSSFERSSFRGADQNPGSLLNGNRHRSISRLISVPGGNHFLFDSDNLDFAVVRLHRITDPLSNELMGKRGHIGNRSAARFRLVFTDDPERLAATIVAENRDPGAERDRCRARGLRLQNGARDAFREIACIPRGQFQSATALIGVLYHLRRFERLLAFGEGPLERTQAG
jgi:hypothetical protein